MVVEDIDRFDRKIAEILTDEGELGYLMVILQKGVWSNGKDDIGVDLSVVLPTASGWQFSDRADPEPNEAYEELATGILDWYGERLRIIRWIPEEEAQRVRSAHFA